jgi:hypothetical protein
MLSTARPTPLRFAGFLALTLGGAATGLGALLTWATVGFPKDLEGALDVQVRGTDVWEGKVVLAIGVATLVGMVVMRLLATVGAKRVVATLIVVGGIASAGLAGMTAVRADPRFGGIGELDAIARAAAHELNLPIEQVRAQLERTFGTILRVDLGPGIPVTIAGGAIAVLGGGLSLVWAGQSRVSEPAAADEEPA